MDLHANVKRAHSQAWDTVAADKSLPDLDVNVLIKFLFDLFVNDKKKRISIIKEYAKKYGPVFKAYGSIFTEDFITNTINEALQQSDREEFRAMAEDGIAKILVKSSKKVFITIAAYLSKEISEEEFLIRMSKTGIGEVGVKIMDAFDINPSSMNFTPELILKYSGPFLAYQGAMGAYREYSKAMDDLRLARESRQRVEDECRQSIEMIRNYRMEAELIVSKYMNEHLDAFESGFAAMNQAMIENDPDGYIAGNVQIQEIMGAKIQFTNQEEFDALMDSDEDFIF